MNFNIEFITTRSGITGVSLNFTNIAPTINNIENNEIDLSYTDKKLNAKIIMKNNSAKQVIALLKGNGNKKISTKVCKITKNDLDSLNIKFKFVSTHLLNHDFSKSSLIISNPKTSSNPDIIYQFEIKYTAMEIENLVKIAREDVKKKANTHKENKEKKNRKKEKEKRRVLEKRPFKESTQQLIKQFEEMVKINTSHKDKELKSKGIHLTHPNAFKKCDNCANFNSSGKCSSHQVEVSENHSCKRFYSYKTVLGGAFSPR